MKKGLYIIVAIILFSCNGENTPDCFQNAGDIIEKEFEVECDHFIPLFGLSPKLGPIGNWGLEIEKNAPIKTIKKLFLLIA